MNNLQRTDEWKAARLGKVTASRFGAVMTQAKKAGAVSATAKSYMYELITELITGESKQLENDALDHGTEYETDAIMEYEEATMSEVIDSDFVDYFGDIELFRGMVGGSPDGLVGKDKIIEAKCPYNSVIHTTYMIERAIPKAYYAQMQGNLWLTGRTVCDFISFDPRVKNGTRLAIIKVDRDEEYIAKLQGALAGFINEYKILIEKYAPWKM